ncbi:preprotein translocase subunit SecE [Mycoplasma elephantis]|uniref:preprotein translocase subunit SecE n=1 Tax=Mycoplasma elephantis TaxID=114882 RepID=UPI00048822CD|nr:preprotein translocase subunit SecE [Mycoplasma elephantis]
MQNEIKDEKQKKPKKYYFRKFIKEIKMVRWPNAKQIKSSFVIVIIFSIIFVLVVLLLMTLIGMAFSGMGVN